VSERGQASPHREESERRSQTGRAGKEEGKITKKHRDRFFFAIEVFFSDALALSVSPPLVLIYLPARHLRKWSLRDAKGSLCACAELSNGSVSRSRETERERKAEEEKNS
jgi:hypothetical protein